jgi:flagellar biosynthesis/type III secretory pathway protein FliH
MGAMAMAGKGLYKKGKRKGKAEGMEEGMKQGEMSAAQMIAKRKDEAARRARGVM